MHVGILEACMHNAIQFSTIRLEIVQPIELCPYTKKKLSSIMALLQF